MLYRHFPDIPQPLATRGKMNVLMEIASTNPASGIADAAGQSPLRSLMEETLGTALEDGLVIDATIAAADSSSVTVATLSSARGATMEPVCPPLPPVPPRSSSLDATPSSQELVAPTSSLTNNVKLLTKV